VYNIKKYVPCVEYTHHGTNGTYQTALTMSGMKRAEVESDPDEFTARMEETPFLGEIIPKMLDYYETDNYIFVHGWIPCYEERYRSGEKIYYKATKWRVSSEFQWARARWYNGMAAAKCGVTEKGKTIVCGHFRTAWGHSVIEGKGDDYGEGADFSPYINDGIIALDSCVSFSKKLNCIIIED